VKLLLDRSTGVDATGSHRPRSNALHLPDHRGYAEVVKVLLNRGARQSGMQLYYIVQLSIAITKWFKFSFRKI